MNTDFRQRQIFNKIMADLKLSERGSVLPEPSELHSEVELTNTNSYYDFNLLDSAGQPSGKEVFLDRNDLFVVSDLLFYLVYQDDDKQGADIPQTYPNKAVFGTTSGFTYTHLMSVYNGHFEMKVGSRVNINHLPMINFLRVPDTQKIAAVNISGVQNTQAIDWSAFSIEEMTYKLGSLIYLRGNQDVQSRVYIDNFSGLAIASADSGYSNILVMKALGYLVKNGAGMI